MNKLCPSHADLQALQEWKASGHVEGFTISSVASVFYYFSVVNGKGNAKNRKLKSIYFSLMYLTSSCFHKVSYTRSHIVDSNVKPDWPGRYKRNWDNEKIFHLLLCSQSNLRSFCFPSQKRQQLPIPLAHTIYCKSWNGNLKRFWREIKFTMPFPFKVQSACGTEESCARSTWVIFWTFSLYYIGKFSAKYFGFLASDLNWKLHIRCTVTFALI